MTEGQPPRQDPQSPQSPQSLASAGPGPVLRPSAGSGRPAGPTSGPGPQYYAPPPGQQPSNGMAIAALVLGILAVVFFFLFFPIGFILAVLAIIFGFIGRATGEPGPAPRPQGHGARRASSSA